MYYYNHHDQVLSNKLALYISLYLRCGLNQSDLDNANLTEMWLSKVRPQAKLLCVCQPLGFGSSN